MNFKPNIPCDAMFSLYGVYHKVGIHDKIFKWDGFEWILSRKNHDDVVYDLNMSACKSHKDCFVINNYYKSQLQPEIEKIKRGKK